MFSFPSWCSACVLACWFISIKLLKTLGKQENLAKNFFPSSSPSPLSLVFGKEKKKRTRLAHSTRPPPLLISFLLNNRSSLARNCKSEQLQIAKSFFLINFLHSFSLFLCFKENFFKEQPNTKFSWAERNTTRIANKLIIENNEMIPSCKWTWRANWVRRLPTDRPTEGPTVRPSIE